MRKRLTMVDIAKKAGVGTTTISRYFNDGVLSEKTREKIKKIVEKYNYRPNTFAKALKSYDTKIIGIIVPAFHSFASSKTLRYLDLYLKELGYDILVLNSNFNEEEQLKYIKHLYRIHVSAIILLPTTVNSKYEEIIKSVDVPVIIIGQHVDFTYSIEYNDFEAGQEITEYILNKGHKKITYIGVSEEDIAVGIERKRGIISKLEEYNLKLENEYISKFSLREAKKVVSQNIENINKTTCIICATDKIAYGTIQALNENNIVAGRDISIVGFGNYESSEFLKYPLTTVDFNVEDAVKKAVKLVVKLEKSEKKSKLNEIIKHSLIKRESVFSIDK